MTPSERTSPAIGVCYFPEHWPRDRWKTDAEQMVEAGIDYVRMGEFSWGALEPSRGAFRFDWLDAAIDLLTDHGLEVVLGTPTATPPKWLIDEHPDIRQAAPDGTPRSFGSRRHYCFNSATYRDETRRLVSRLASRYADTPGLVGWQIDNEFGCHGTVRCYCEECSAAFSEWLATEYDDIDALNETWGTTFWSQQYTSFEAIDPPRPTPADHHPSHLLDYHRFASESVVTYNRLQADILRAADDWAITHNFMGDFETLDAHRVSEALDFVTWDSYPTGFVQDRRTGAPSLDELRAGDPDQVGMSHDLYRSLTDAPFWVMEQQPGDVNWPPHSPQPGNGAMRLWAHHAVAHGAEAVLYFRWRRCRQGQEQYHAGLRKQDGSPDRGYADATTAATELADISTAVVDAPVALLHDYENWWALSAQPHAPEFDYWEHLRTYYRGLRARGVQVDIVHPEASLDEYRAVVAPSLHLADSSLAAHLTAFANDGGHLLLGARSGVKTPRNQLHETLAPGPFADLAGVTVDQHESLPADVAQSVTMDGTTYPYSVWGEWLSPTAATDVVATHDAGPGADTPAITRTTAGAGTVTYCGVWPDSELTDALVTDLLSAAAIDASPRLPDGVRLNDCGSLTWVTNFTSDRYTLADVASDAVVIGSLPVDPFDAVAVTTPRSALTIREHVSR